MTTTPSNAPPRPWSCDETVDDFMHQPGAIALAPGRMLNDRIRLEHLLGEGGMGSVWVAEHLTLGSRVAVKFVRTVEDENTSRVELFQRFVKEASAVARMTSPHVVRTFDFGAMLDGTPYLVMELLEGESLGDRIDRCNALEPAEVARIVSQAATALAEAHRMNVIHRDVKPANIFLTRSGRDTFVKLLDFGIAKDIDAATGATTKSGFLMGTPQYMSPERLVNPKVADRHVDMWALAATAYEAIAGRRPFDGPNLPQIVIAIRLQHYTPPSCLPCSVHFSDVGRLDAFFRRAFAQNIEARFGSVLEMADEFASLCAPKRMMKSIAARTIRGGPIPEAQLDYTGLDTGPDTIRDAPRTLTPIELAPRTERAGQSFDRTSAAFDYALPLEAAPSTFRPNATVTEAPVAMVSVPPSAPRKRNRWFLPVALAFLAGAIGASVLAIAESSAGTRETKAVVHHVEAPRAAEQPPSATSVAQPPAREAIVLSASAVSSSAATVEPAKPVPSATATARPMPRRNVAPAHGAQIDLRGLWRAINGPSRNARKRGSKNFTLPF